MCTKNYQEPPFTYSFTPSKQLHMSLNRSITQWFDKIFYPNYKKGWDNDMFRAFTLPYLNNEHTVLLDLGAGRGAIPQMNFRDLVKTAVGVDPEEVVHTNPFLHEAHVGFGHHMPFFEANRFDLIVSNNVLEHITDPDHFFKEVARVIKPGGVLITKTPNLYHYMPSIARITPTSFHRFINKLRGTPGFDIFPTKYEANTRAAQTKFAKNSGFEIEKFLLVEGRPEYLRFNFITYPFGIIYERLVNGLGLDTFKIVIFTVMRKQ
jgi:2-polyprenyl-3-methyl-5-hydroxy-6-metoxy-1,4-benzoquinol methylase